MHKLFLNWSKYLKGEGYIKNIDFNIRCCDVKSSIVYMELFSL